MVDVQVDEKSRWLSLGDACRLLDVSQATLRLWADGGRLRVYRTPGGHRRFLREDVVAITNGNSTPADSNNPEALEKSALRRIRRGLHQPTAANQPWRQGVDSEGKFRMRVFGRRLLSLLTEEQPLRTRHQEAVAEAYLLGRQYGAEMADKRVTLKDTVEALIFFRTMVLDSASSAAWNRILELADRVLVGVTASYEERLSGTNSTGEQPGAPLPGASLTVEPVTTQEG